MISINSYSFAQLDKKIKIEIENKDPLILEEYNNLPQKLEYTIINTTKDTILLPINFKNIFPETNFIKEDNVLILSIKDENGIIYSSFLGIVNLESAVTVDNLFGTNEKEEEIILPYEKKAKKYYLNLPDVLYFQGAVLCNRYVLEYNKSYSISLKLKINEKIIESNNISATFVKNNNKYKKETRIIRLRN